MAEDACVFFHGLIQNHEQVIPLPLIVFLGDGTV